MNRSTVAIVLALIITTFDQLNVKAGGAGVVSIDVSFIAHIITSITAGVERIVSCTKQRSTTSRVVGRVGFWFDGTIMNERDGVIIIRVANELETGESIIIDITSSRLSIGDTGRRRARSSGARSGVSTCCVAWADDRVCTTRDWVVYTLRSSWACDSSVIVNGNCLTIRFNHIQSEDEEDDGDDENIH